MGDGGEHWISIDSQYFLKTDVNMSVRFRLSYVFVGMFPALLSLLWFVSGAAFSSSVRFQLFLVGSFPALLSLCWFVSGSAFSLLVRFRLLSLHPFFSGSAFSLSVRFGFPISSSLIVALFLHGQ